PNDAVARAQQDVHKKYVTGAAATATALPQPATDRAEPLRITVSVGGDPVEISLLPAAIPDLLIDRYCAGGWPDARRIGRDILARVTGIQPLAIPGPGSASSI